MKLALLILLLAGLVVYAYRDWFVSLCGLIVLSAFMKNDSMPTNVMGIQGANPWNLLFAVVLFAWLMEKLQHRQGRELPRPVIFLFLGYAGIMFVSFVRGFVDVGHMAIVGRQQEAMSSLGFFSEYFINPAKYLFAACLLFDGARTRKRMMLGIGAMLAQAACYGLLVLKVVPLWVLTVAGKSPFRYRIDRDVGLHANDMALVLVIGFWSAMACLAGWRYMRWWWRVGLLGAAAVMFLGLGLCNSRGGFAAFVACALLFAVLRWRWLLAAMPVAAIAICATMPSVPARILVGMETTDVAGHETEDLDAISAGRTTYLWPPAIQQIEQSPIVGYGRMAILRTPLYARIVELSGSCPNHPHNAYLEMLLDSGAIGLLFTVGFFASAGLLGFRVGRAKHPLLMVAANIGLAGALTLGVMAMTGQTFYPREGIFVALLAYALMLRAYVADKKLAAASPEQSRRANAHGRPAPAGFPARRPIAPAGAAMPTGAYQG